MRLLARYLLREALVALAYCFSAFLILWVMLQLLSDLHTFQENKLRITDVFEYYFFKVPDFLPIALPVALLLALLYALTNHARHNEITAIRAAGVSLWRLSLPYFSMGAVSAVLLFSMNEFVAPTTGDIADDILDGRVESNHNTDNKDQIKNVNFNNASAARLWHIDVYNTRTAEMIGPQVDWKLPDGVIRSIKADRGIYTNAMWQFFQVREIRRPAAPGAPQIKLPATNSMTFPEFAETPEMIRSEINVSDRYGRQGKTHRADVPLAQIRDYLHLHPNPERSIRAWLFTKMHGRLAGPFTCLVVVILAVPFATAPGRRNVFVGVAASISIFFAYYILQQIGFALGEAGHVPAWFGAWFPNLLFGATGLVLMARVR